MWPFGRPNIERLRVRGDVRALARVLGRKKDIVVRREAARALGDIGSQAREPGTCERVARALQEALSDEGFDDHHAVAAALEQMCASHRGTTFCAAAIEPLTSMLMDRRVPFQVRLTAARVLGIIPDAGAVKPLVWQLSDKSRALRQTAAESLVALYQSGQLDDAARRAILDQRGRITRQHEDRRPTRHADHEVSHQHSDRHTYSDCSGHQDYWMKKHTDQEATGRHIDTGVGIQFPI